MLRRKRGGRLLSYWLEEHDLTQAEFAPQIKSTQQNISRWIRGGVIPLEQAIAIERLTGISVESWLLPDESRHARAC